MVLPRTPRLKAGEREGGCRRQRLEYAHTYAYATNTRVLAAFSCNQTTVALCAPEGNSSQCCLGFSLLAQTSLPKLTGYSRRRWPRNPLSPSCPVRLLLAILLFYLASCTSFKPGQTSACLIQVTLALTCNANTPFPELGLAPASALCHGSMYQHSHAGVFYSRAFV